MTNYNERLDEILHDLYLAGWNDKLLDDSPTAVPSENQEKREAKQALTSLIKELVAEQIVQALKELKEEVIGEVPSKINTDNWKYDKRVAELKIWQHQAIDNKIKQLEEV